MKIDFSDVACAFVAGFTLAFVSMCYWAGSMRLADRLPENAWRIYQESKIDEAARMAKEVLK